MLSYILVISKIVVNNIKCVADSYVFCQGQHMFSYMCDIQNSRKL